VFPSGEGLRRSGFSGGDLGFRRAVGLPRRVSSRPAAASTRDPPFLESLCAIRVKSLDKNGDGKITKQEAGGAPWFDRVDQNNDGVLDATELETVRQASATWPGGGSTPNPGAAPQGGGQLIERIKSLDTNGDGRITKEEAGGAAWFGRADRNNDGVIDAAELEALRRGTGARRGVTNR